MTLAAHSTGPESEKGAASSNRDDGPGRGQIVRWLLAVGIALGAVAFYLHGVDAQTVCRETLTSGGQVRELCGPPAVGDLAPFAVLIAVVLAPDFTELAIPGLLSLKRAVGRQEQRQERLETQVSQIQQRVDNRIDFKVEMNLAEKDVSAKEKALLGAAEEEEDQPPEGGVDAPNVPPPPDMNGGNGMEGTAEPEILAEEEVALPGTETVPSSPTETPELPSDEDDLRASLTLQLAWLSKNLTQFEAISRLRLVDKEKRMAGLTEEQQQSVDRWYAVFGEEIRLIQKFRNVLAHNPYAIDIDELKEAVRIGRRLTRILLGGIGTSTESLDRFEEP